MARMSIDDRFLRDPRVQRMALAMGWSKYEARGRLLDVFAVVYDAIQAGREGHLQPFDVDVAADFPGFAQRMIEFDLAVEVRGGLHIRGTKEHTSYLSSRRESGRAGGIKSAEVRREKSKQKTKVTFAEIEGRGNPSASASSSVPDPASASAPDPVPEEKNSAPASPGGSRSRKPKPSEPTPEERALAGWILSRLGQRSGVQYSGAKEHVRLIVSRLRDGVSEADLRKVIGYCAIDLGWAQKPEMAPYLRPETLFGPKTIAKYLDPARAWFAKNNHELEPYIASEQPGGSS